MKKFSFVFFFVFSFFFTFQALAAEKIAFGLNTVLQELNCSPGTTVEGSFEVVNKGSQESPFYFELIGYRNTASQNSNDPVTKPIVALPADNLVRHTTLPANVSIPGNSSKKVPYSIAVPATLKGTQYLGISVLSGNSDQQTAFTPEEMEEQRKTGYSSKTGAAFKSAIVLSITCNIQGTLAHSYAVDSLTFTPRQKESDPLSAEMKVHNTGNAEIKFFPVIVLTDAQKKVAARLVPERGSKIIPNGTETISFKPSYKNIARGAYTAVIVPSTRPGQNLTTTEMKVTLK